MSDLRYQALSEEERELGDALLEGALAEPDIVSKVDEFHARGSKCAIVIVITNQKLRESYVAAMNVAVSQFPFVQVEQVLDRYDPKDSICLILVRDGGVAALIGPRG